MNTNRFKRFAGLLFALTVATTSAFAGNNPCRNSMNRGSCISQISNLTTEQHEKFSALQTKHLNTMDQLRENRRSTTDVTRKTQIREEMDAEIQNYRNELKSFLAPDQQNQLMNSTQGKGKNQGKGNGSCGNPKGKNNGKGKGQRSGTGTCRQS